MGLIDKKEVYTEAVRRLNKLRELERFLCCSDVINVINAIVEAEEIEVKEAEWINTYGDSPYDVRDKNYWWHCSNCKHSLTAPFKSKYCPECGARMKGTKE